MPIETSAPDPIPEPPPRRKPRRLWLFAPYAALAALAAAYGGYWLFAKARLEAGLDARAEALRGAGYAIEMTGRRLSGFPFRLKLEIDEARLAAPAGWSVSIPGLKAEAYLHDVGHWVVVAPKGLTFVRPKGGALAVTGKALQASIAGVSGKPWRVVLDGAKLVFAPAPGARPFSLASADLLQLYLRPAPGGTEGMTLLRLEGGKAGAGSLLHAMAGDAVVTATLQARLTQPGAFVGKDWGQAVRAWSRAGGVAKAVEGQLAGGAVTVRTKDGTLGVGSEGRLVGAVPLEWQGAEKALAAMSGPQALDPDAAGSAAAVAAARARGQAASLNLVFEAGAATLGPVRIGPSPRVG